MAKILLDITNKSKYNYTLEIIMIKDILSDIVEHTYGLEWLPLLKITGTDTETIIESRAEDKSVVLIATTKQVVSEMKGVFGMPNLDKLSFHLKNPEYKENSTIDIVTANKKGQDIPVSLHFENETKDFMNDYRLMDQEIVSEKLKTPTFKGATWEIDFEPAVSSIARLKLQSQANSEETFFQVKTDNGNLVFSFGDAASHAGSFVFQNNVSKKLKSVHAWPVKQVLGILNLNGDKTIKISDGGLMQITVDSGLAVYNYLLPAQVK